MLQCADRTTLIDQAGIRFRERFGRAPRFGACAPGRVNLIGEHTDYNDGFAMPLAIDRFTVILADHANANSAVSTLWADDLQEAYEIDLTKPLQPSQTRFANYLLGVVDQFSKRGHSLANLDLLVMGNVPQGSGLSSSASVEVAMATLLEQITGEILPPREKPLLCQAAENTFPGVPCGVMDMFIISLAQKETAMLLDCRSYEYKLAPFPSAEQATLLVVDTRTERALVSGEYALRRNACHRAAKKLGVAALRDANAKMLDQANDLDEIERRCARHVVNENARTLQAAAALREGALDRLGALMVQSHESLRDLYEVSTPELNAVVEVAERVGAAERVNSVGTRVFGARMTGAGFGGCAIVLCTPEAVGEITVKLKAQLVRRFGREPEVFAVSASDGARTLQPGEI